MYELVRKEEEGPSVLGLVFDAESQAFTPSLSIPSNFQLQLCRWCGISVSNERKETSSDSLFHALLVVRHNNSGSGASPFPSGGFPGNFRILSSSSWHFSARGLLSAFFPGHKFVHLEVWIQKSFPLWTHNTR